MEKQRKDYLGEFKVDAVRILNEGELSTQRIAEDLGIGASTLLKPQALVSINFWC